MLETKKGERKPSLCLRVRKVIQMRIKGGSVVCMCFTNSDVCA